MDLNDVQEGVLNIAFRVADEQGLLLLDLKDLRAMLGFLAEHADELTTQYGNVSKATIGTIQRQLLVLENQGAHQVLRRAGAGAEGPDAHRAATAAATSTSWSPTS